MTGSGAIPSVVAPRRQDQTAGDDSLQQQAGESIINVTYVVGITAAEVVEIQNENTRQVRAELASVANTVVDERLRRFERQIDDRFAQEPELRPAFADPDFQFSLLDATRAAASNDDDHTEDLLIDLLANRAQEGNSARLRLVTSHAIRAADKLSAEALTGLTANWVLTSIGPLQPSALNYLTNNAALAEKLVELGLPQDPGWVEELEALGLAQTVRGIGSNRKPYREYLPARASQCLIRGIETNTAEQEINAALAGWPELRPKLSAHIKPGFIVLPGANADELLAEAPPVENRPPELASLIEMNGYGQVDPAAKEEFVRRMDESEDIVKVATWWDPLPTFHLTLVGRSIGLVNARRRIEFRGARTIAEMLDPATS